MKKYIYTTLILLAGAATLHAAQLPDSVREASKAEYRIRKGVNFDLSFGVGAGRMEFNQIGASSAPEHITNMISYPNWNAAVGINWYFVPWMGLGTGVHFSTYANRSLIDKPWTSSGFDYQGHLYNFTATPVNLSEQQSLYMIEIPLSLRFRAIKRSVGFHGVAGIKLGLPIYDSYSLSGGSFHNQVSYDHWSLTIIDNIPGVIEDFNVSRSAGNMSGLLRNVNIGAYTEIGMLIRLQQRLDLLLALTGTYYLNDVLSPSSSRSALGFDEAFIPGQYPSPFSATYRGVLRSNEVQELHPWSVALKIGLSINVGRTQAKRAYDQEQRERRKAKREEEERAQHEADSLRALQTIVVIPIDTTPVDTVPAVEPTPEVDPKCEQIREQILALIAECGMSVCDFCPVIHDTIYIYAQDTLSAVEVVPTVTDTLVNIMESAVIWFKLDDTIPILEPEDILVRIAEVLVSHPEQQVEVNGHTCMLGKKEYNRKLALRRAQAVANRLCKLGVKPEQLIVQSLGADVPYRFNGKHQLNKDRRVEILPLTGAPAPQQANTLPTIEVVLAGSRLAQIARRYYGNPDYWVFIYEANKDKITDPDNLPANTELIVPDLTERLNGQSPAQIEQIIQDIKRAAAQHSKQ